jgi:outer membrane receptor protein involved in Fe transport
VQQGTTSQAAATTTLTKNIAALYAGYAYNHKSLTARAGARLEGAWYNSQSVSSKTENYNSALVNVVPYLSLSYKIKEGHNLSLSYSERLSRPGIQSLSPYVTETSLSRSYGNPDLKTGVNHSVRLKYAWMNNKWTVSPELMTMFSNNRVAVYQFVDKEGLINQTWLNHGRNRAYALQTSLSYRPSQKLQLAADLRVGYFEDGIPSENVAVAGWAFSESVNVTVGLWKGARLTLSEYCAKMQPQQTMVAQNWFLTTSARLGQKLLKDKLELSLSVQNPHSKTMKHELLMTAPTYVQNLIATNISRSIRLSVSYRFGKQGLYVKKTKRKSDSTTEDVGGSGQQQGGTL